MENKRIHIIYSGLFGLLFILVVVALIFSIADIDCDSLSFSLDKGATLIGIFVSTLGLLVTAYFILLAIDAYSHIKNVKNDIEDFQIQKVKFDTLLQDYAQSLFDCLDYQVWFAEGSKNKNARNDLLLTQARLSYKYPMLNSQARITLLCRLADIGTLDDINNVKLLTLDPKEDTEIKEFALLVLDSLKKTHGIS